MIVNPVNDIFRQAHQGSVAAIIQVLNDKLADSGVRTRAIFAHGVLQLLCEAASSEQLDRAILIDRIRKTLESIAPKNIRRVNINCRIVREQQLLWLEEISRDPDSQLLWSQEISLRRPNLIKATIEDWREAFSNRDDVPRMQSPQVVREKRQFTKGILGGMFLTSALLLAGWGVYNSSPIHGGRRFLLISESETAKTQPASNQQQTNSKETVNRNGEPFAVAVRLAEQAAQASLTAQTSDEWRKISEMWREASTLMGAVPQTHPRYEVAQNRTTVYRQNQASASSRVK
jgi:hypothetical protein